MEKCFPFLSSSPWTDSFNIIQLLWEDVELFLSWKTMILSYSTWKSLKSTEFLSWSRFHQGWLVEQGEVRTHTGLVLFSQRTGASEDPAITSRNAIAPTTDWPWMPKVLVSLSKFSSLIDLDFFFFLFKYKRLDDLFKYFYCYIRKWVQFASPSGTPTLFQHLLNALACDWTLRISPDLCMTRYG